jgi:hypothetical protein
MTGQCGFGSSEEQMRSVKNLMVLCIMGYMVRMLEHGISIQT